ncbi:unnamed protein product [Coccothraustes coccothraustes]
MSAPKSCLKPCHIWSPVTPALSLSPGGAASWGSSTLPSCGGRHLPSSVQGPGLPSSGRMASPPPPSLRARQESCAEAAAPRPRDAATASPRTTEAAGGASTRSSNSNSNSSSSSSSSRLAEVSAPPEQGQPMTQRALSVLVLASAALIVYFVIRTVRLRRQNRKTRRYGVLDTNIENMELTPLEQDDDDDDDTTLFDASHPRSWRRDVKNT